MEVSEKVQGIFARKILVGWSQMELKDFFKIARFGIFDVFPSLKLTKMSLKIGPN